MDPKSILVDETQSTVAPKCAFIHHKPRIRLGIPAMRVVMIRPMIPNLGMSSMLKGNPMAEVTKVSRRLTLVSPWLFMRFPRLRIPKAENR